MVISDSILTAKEVCDEKNKFDPVILVPERGKRVSPKC